MNDLENLDFKKDKPLGYGYIFILSYKDFSRPYRYGKRTKNNETLLNNRIEVCKIAFAETICKYNKDVSYDEVLAEIEVSNVNHVATQEEYNKIHENIMNNNYFFKL